METIVLSDIHLADAEREHPKRPLWKAFKRREYFVDNDMANLLRWLRNDHDEPMELILNGDIFDFDAICKLPDPPPSPIHWLQRLRGLGSEEWMSVFKMDCIVQDHPIWFEMLGDWLRAGHKLVFVIGNHDLEMYWPAVQARIRQAVSVSDEEQQRLVFCDWFYLSGGDTYVSHGHQYEAYCVTPDAVNPLISVGGKPRVRIPFGDLANRYMINGMGYFNPHATANYIMTGPQYIVFFLRYMLLTQPLLLWTWAWGAAATLVITFLDFLRPAMRDPMTIEDKVAGIAERANATPAMVRQLVAVDVASACTNPLMIVQELWLDRGVLFLLTLYAAFQIIVWVNFVLPISTWWVLVPLLLLFPLFLAYSFRVKPQTFTEPLLTPERAEIITKITGARIAVMGHTHIPELSEVGPMQFCNAGFWSPAFAEPTCKTRLGAQTFARIRAVQGTERRAELWEWPVGADKAKIHEIGK
jgi:UDP-2,3-diacylglucosamine pyrophosphatase LpxH